MPLLPNALTDYATVIASLGIASPIDQALIEGFINRASSAIERVTNRRLVYGAGIVERYATFGSNRLLVDRSPLVLIGALSDAFGAVDPSDVFVDDALAGVIWRDAGWPSSARLRPGVTQFTLDMQPGTERKSTYATYAGGYITAPQSYTAAAWPGAAAVVPVGTLCRPAAQQAQLWQATPSALNVVLVGGATEPAWPASPVIGATLIDGTFTWVYLGSVGSAGTPGTAVSLPADLEQSAVTASAWLYRTRKRDPSIKSESMLGVSYSYADKQAELPPDSLATALAYARTV